VRDDPLAAYADLEAVYYPNGIPQRERGVALDLLRATRARQMLGGPVPGFMAAPPVLLPAPVMPCPAPASTAPSAPAPSVPAPLPPAPAPALGLSAQLRGVQAVATPINAAGQADWDSLLVNLSGISAAGSVIPVAGGSTVQATLWGRKQRVIHALGEQFFGDPGRIERIAEWTVVLDDSSLQLPPLGSISPTGPAVRSLVLPLPRPLPDHDITRYPFAELSVEVLAPGQGVFMAQQPDLVLKHLSPLRETLAAYTGSRFFPEESTTDSRRFAGPRFERSSLLGPNSRIFSVQP
jgi:hypothetical protein